MRVSFTGAFLLFFISSVSCFAVQVSATKLDLNSCDIHINESTGSKDQQSTTQHQTSYVISGLSQKKTFDRSKVILLRQGWIIRDVDRKRGIINADIQLKVYLGLKITLHRINNNTTKVELMTYHPKRVSMLGGGIHYSMCEIKAYQESLECISGRVAK